MTATLHQSLSVLPHLNRCFYDDIFADKFLSETKVAMDSKHLDPCICGKFVTIITETKEILQKEKESFTIVHLDLGEKNIIHNGNIISPIDFSMAGYGIPEMDLGDLFNMIRDSQLRLALLSGYESVTEYKLNREYLSIFEAFSLIQYILIHHTKLYMDEEFNNRIGRWTSAIFDPLLLQIKQK